MKIMLSPGETLQVGYLDDEGRETDGGLSVVYGKDSIKVETDWPDTEGRTGVVYEEKFGLHLDPDEVDCLAQVMPVQHDWSNATDSEIRFDERRHIAASEVVENFNFDPAGKDNIEDISHSNSWSYTVGGDHWSMPVFVSYKGDETSTKYTLTIEFKPGTNEVIEAIAEGGNDDTIVENYGKPTA